MKGIGKILKDHREKEGITLDEIYDATKIQKKYLIAIEQDDAGAFVAGVYYKSFSKAYAKYLGLDIDEMYRAIEREKADIQEVIKEEKEKEKEKEKSKSKPKEIKEPVKEKVIEEKKEVVQERKNVAGFFQETKLKKIKEKFSLKKLLIICGVAVFVLLILSSLVFFRGSSSEKPVVDNTAAPVSSTPVEIEQVADNFIKKELPAEKNNVAANLPAPIVSNVAVANTNNTPKLDNLTKVDLATPKNLNQQTQKIQKKDANPLVSSKEMQILTINAIDDVWVRVESDGQIVFEQTLTANSDRYEFEAYDNFVIIVGNAPAIEMFFNGKKIDPRVGAKQDVNRIVLRK